MEQLKQQLRAEGIDTITFQTILCSTTLSVDELLAMGGEDAEAVLTHRLTDSSLTVGCSTTLPFPQA